MHMRDDDRAAVELDDAEPPRHALAVKQFVAVMQRRFRNQFAGAILGTPVEPVRQAFAAGLARRILHRAAVAADLQFELTARRRGSQPERDAAAAAGRQRRDARAQDRIFARRPHQWTRHYFCYCPAARMAAPLHRPRS